jgi:hypothetical protein
MRCFLIGRKEWGQLRSYVKDGGVQRSGQHSSGNECHLRPFFTPSPHLDLTRSGTPQRTPGVGNAPAAAAAVPAAAVATALLAAAAISTTTTVITTAWTMSRERRDGSGGEAHTKREREREGGW